MYQAPDFVRIDITVKNSYAGSPCNYDEGTDYTKVSVASICSGGADYSTYIDVVPSTPYMCYSTYNP